MSALFEYVAAAVATLFIACTHLDLIGIAGVAAVALFFVLVYLFAREYRSELGD